MGNGVSVTPPGAAPTVPQAFRHRGTGSGWIETVVDAAVVKAAGQANLVVDIADLAVSKTPNTTLITYSLGSCIGVSIWDPVAKVAGLLHFMLPESSISPERAQANPAMFCDTGVPRLFHAAYELGAVKRRLIVKIAGGSQLLDDKGTFNIGKRNYLALRKVFWKNGIMIDNEHTGGTISRTMRVETATGDVVIRIRGAEVLL